MSTTPPKRSQSQRGFGLIAALMVTLVIGGLAVVLARMTATQAVSFALDERGVRAYWAARAGLEWGSYQRAINNSCAASTVVAMPVTATSLTEYQVTVECAPPGPGSGPRLLTATACAPAAECPPASPALRSATYVERVLTRTMP